MIQLSHTGTQTNMPGSKINTDNWKSVIFFGSHFPVESCHILLPSSLLDFVPCDLKLQKAHCKKRIHSTSVTSCRGLTFQKEIPLSTLSVEQSYLVPVAVVKRDGKIKGICRYMTWH